MNKPQISNIRTDYTSRTLDISIVDTNPINQFKAWFDEVLNLGIEEPNAMILATAGHNMQPSARIVLLRDFCEAGFIFYTNYDSTKGKQIEDNPKAALTFFWKELEQQVRIEGIIKKIPDQDSDKYFHARPFESRLSAAISPQSHVIPNRGYLENLREGLRKQFTKQDLPRPQNWGGYIVKPKSIEFWQGRAGRLHDRIMYTLENKSWKIELLAP